MAGNSWLGISQWFIAAEAPPHLKCIAPLEGASDIYREMAVRGGVPNHAYTASIQTKLYGKVPTTPDRKSLSHCTTQRRLIARRPAKSGRYSFHDYEVPSVERLLGGQARPNGENQDSRLCAG